MLHKEIMGDFKVAIGIVHHVKIITGLSQGEWIKLFDTIKNKIIAMPCI